MAPFASLSKYSHIGLLILRGGVGAMFLTHGVPKLAKGPQGWETLGRTMGNLGIEFAPTFWGLMAGLTETIGGLSLLLGFWMRALCVPLAFTMAVATVHHLSRGDGLGKASHAIEACFLFVALLFVGPGRYSIDKG
jgi:putative oxidoreductase